jgi:hypothetical protein
VLGRLIESPASVPRPIPCDRLWLRTARRGADLLPGPVPRTAFVVRAMHGPAADTRRDPGPARARFPRGNDSRPARHRGLGRGRYTRIGEAPRYRRHDGRENGQDFAE